MIAFEEAQRRVAALACGPARRTCEFPLGEAVGRVLASTLRAPNDLVPYARSAMDGFAVRASDVGAAATLPVRGAVFAESGAAEHGPGTATAIATGGALPRGADAVVPFERTVRENGSVRIAGPLEAGLHVFPAGDDARAGDTLLAAGTRLRGAMLGILAAAGYARVPVFERPRIALLLTGNELVPIESVPHVGQIRDSNAPVLAAALAEFGGEVVRVARVADDARALRAALAAALDEVDLVVTCGGASVGERDLVKPLARELGVAFAFEAVALRPAKPSAFGARGEVLVAVLPGNPASAFVALHEFVRPALRVRSGERGEPFLPRVQATLDGTLHGRPQRTFAAFASLRWSGGRFVAKPLDNQCSSLTRGLADADGFALVPPGTGALEPGDEVAVDVLDWTRVGARPAG
ncbi:MAG: gephyrin-like molybdotransferase Glp [Candidatus Baltobacteraceae bacterium]